MAESLLIQAIREFCPDDQQSRDAIEGIEYLNGCFAEGEFRAWVEAYLQEAIRQMRVATLERELAACTTLSDRRKIAHEIEVLRAA